MKTIFLLILFLFLTAITLFRLFSSRPSHSSNPFRVNLQGEPSFQSAFVRLNQPQNPVDKIIKTLYPEPEASLLSGILIGSKAQMPKDFYSALQRTGTLHMIALSGQNISLVISLIAFLLQGLGKKLSSVITVIMIIIFILFVGPSASVIRAGIMGSMVMLSVIYGRQYLAVLGLIISGLIMFIISPGIIFDVGFQLSFSATLGIILLSAPSSLSLRGAVGDEAISNNDSSGQAPQSQRLPRSLWSLAMTIKQSMLFDLKTTLSAQAFTTPIVLFNFHNLSIVAPVSNVLILWTIPILMYAGFAVVLLFLLFNFMNLTNFINFITISHVVSWFLLPFLNWFVLVVNWTANLPFASFQIGSFSLWMAYLYYGILFLTLSLLSLRAGAKQSQQLSSSGLTGGSI